MATGSCRQAVVCLVAAVGFACSSPAVGGMIVTDPSLPPVGGTYEGDPLSQIADYAGVFKATEIRMTDFQNVGRQISGNDEVLTFDVTLTALVIEASGVPQSPPLPVSFTGPLTAVFYDKAGQTLGTYQAEITSANCTGTIGPFAGTIRENPALDSLGETTITDLGGGNYQIDSFFDIFTELSVGGGAFLADANGPHHMVLIPEPATLALLAAAAVGLLGGKRR